MDRAKQLEELNELLEKLRAANQAAPVLVEGTNDRSALRRLGLSGTIVHLNQGTSMVDFCDRLARSHRRLILLPDWDTKGRSLEKRLRQCLEAGGATVVGDFWRKIQRLCGGACRTVEGLLAFKAMLERGD